MEGFGWRRRESGKKLTVMSGYEWCEWKCVRANGTKGLKDQRTNSAKLLTTRVA